MRKLGHVLMLVAMAGYAISVMTLDFYGPRTGPTEMSLTYFDLLTGQGTASGLTVAGGILMTFGPLLLIVILDLMLLTDRRRGVALHGLVAAVATWGTITIGSALNILGFSAFPMGVGFWTQIVCVGIATAGTLLLLNAPAGDRSGVTRPRNLGRTAPALVADAGAELRVDSPGRVSRRRYRRSPTPRPVGALPSP